MCTTLEPFSICGSGECLNNTCVCNDGFSATTEFFFDEISGDEDSFYCDYNRTAVLVLNWITLVFSCFTIVYQLSVLRNRKQLKRISALLVGLMLIICCSIARVVYPDKVLFIENPLFTIALAEAFSLFIISALVFYNKYIAYMLRTFQISETTRIIASGVLKFQYVLGIVAFLNFNLWSVASFIQRDEVSFVLVKIQHGVNAFFHVFAVLSAYFLLLQYLNDLNEVIARAKEVGEDSSSVDKRFVQLCKRTLPKIVAMRYVIIAFNSFLFLLFFIGLFWDWWFKQWTYIVPISMICWNIVCLTAVRGTNRRRRHGQTSASQILNNAGDTSKKILTAVISSTKFTSSTETDDKI